MIVSFKDRDTEHLFNTGKSRRFNNVLGVARRKLQMLDDAATLVSLMSPPGNMLEALSRDRRGQHSIRVNGQWRVCFRWTDSGPADVEICDYH